MAAGGPAHFPEEPRAVLELAVVGFLQMIRSVMSANRESSGGERPRALIVDDDVLLRRVLRTALAHAGFDVAQVGTGRDALSLAKAYDFDVIVTDLQMPGMSGAQLLSSLRQLRDPTPVIVMSGAPEARADLLMAGGAFAFLPKPFGLDELVRLAWRAVDLSQARTLPPPASGALPRDLVGNVA